MKLLEKTQIIAKQTAERKAAIDSGVFIARKVDNLRQDLLNLEKQRADFISGSHEEFEKALGELRIKKVTLEKEITEQEKILAKLREPLDEEWLLVSKTRSEVENLKERTEIAFKQIIEERKEVKNDRQLSSQALLNARNLEKESYVLQRKSQDSVEETKKSLSQAEQLREKLETSVYLEQLRLSAWEKDLSEKESAYKKDLQALNKEKKLLEIKKKRWITST